jgi:protein-S-isoprenylcysteine O-methyltransferase Ste14
VQATKFEFEYRFWIICGIYFVGFALSSVDRTQFIVAVRQLIAPGIIPHRPEAAIFARVVIGFGALLAFAAAALRTWAAAYLQTSIVHDTTQHADALVADGPFRFTRNPLYLGNLPLAAGIGILASRTGFIFLVLGNWLFVYRLILREEQMLRQTQGQAYRFYLNAVPRFWPSLYPGIPAGGRLPHWLQAFAGEAFVWIFAIAELTVAITLNARVGAVVFLLAFASYLIPLRAVNRRRRELAS